jgi:hypothetical protein
MRITFAAAILLVIGVTACNKQDLNDGATPPFNQSAAKKQTTCDLQQSVLTRDGSNGADAGTFSAFRKVYDASGKVSKVVAGIHFLGLQDSVSMLVKTAGKNVYFLKESNPGDTLLIARFNAKKQLQRIDVSSDASDFKPTEFFYTNGKLTSLYIAPFATTKKLQYDGNGNVVRMYDFDNEPTQGTFFTYDQSVSATRQWYASHFRNSSENTMYLAQFMGWLPDLEPVNKCTAYKIVLHDEDATDDTPGALLIEGTLTDHVYDSEGKLTYYKDNSEAFTNTWDCSDKSSIN